MCINSYNDKIYYFIGSNLLKYLWYIIIPHERQIN